MNDRLSGVLFILLGFALVGFGVYTLTEPLFESGFPLFWAIISAGCCSCTIGFTQIRARVLSMPFIVLTILCSAFFFVRAMLYVLI